jgi:dipeptidase
MPEHLSAVIWFGVDDSATTVRVPVFAAATRVPKSFAGAGPQDGTVPPVLTFNLNSVSCHMN